MSVPTFYLSEGFTENSSIVLSGKEAWHALGVKRLDAGDEIRLINGKGSLALATVEQLDGRHSARLKVGEVRHISPLVPDIILATAIAKGDRQSTMLDMVTQLGIRAWQPLLCQRSVSKVGKNSFERWQRICLEACKQSRAAWLPVLLAPAKPEEVTQAAISEGREVLLAHPEGEKLSMSSMSSSKGITLLVGPEGGFTDQEVCRITTAGARQVSLGTNILRVETAAVSLLARFRTAV